VNGSQLKLVMDIGDNVTRNVTDTLADASLGANAPTVATATAAQVALSGIPVGAASVTARKIYRTVAGGAAPYKLLATLADNVTTTYLDALADASLGANAPSGDTSGLKQPDGQVLAGASTLLVAGAAAFRVTGGWALLPGGQNVRYTGISGNSLIGIPPSGIGAVLATINYNATVTAAPALEGIPASGVGAVVIVVKSGDPINLVVQVDDAPAQAQLAAVIGGDGVQEAYLQDNRISETEARARAAAALTLRRTVEETIHYESRDRLTQSGTTIAVNLPLPTNMAGSYKVQQVTISGFEIPTLPPVRTVEASSNRFTFEDLLRLARTVTPPGA
jgi:hypothetical protein